MKNKKIAHIHIHNSINTKNTKKVERIKPLIMNLKIDFHAIIIHWTKKTIKKWTLKNFLKDWSVENHFKIPLFTIFIILSFVLQVNFK